MARIAVDEKRIDRSACRSKTALENFASRVNRFKTYIFSWIYACFSLAGVELSSNTFSYPMNMTLFNYLTIVQIYR